MPSMRAVQVSHFCYRCYDGRWDYRLTFVDENEDEYRLKIVDLNFQTYVDYLRGAKKMHYLEVEELITNALRNKEIFLRIGLARGWANYPDRCYLQINSIFTFPDFLKGKCFADFVLDHVKEDIDDFLEEEIPF